MRDDGKLHPLEVEAKELFEATVICEVFHAVPAVSRMLDQNRVIFDPDWAEERPEWNQNIVPVVYSCMHEVSDHDGGKIVVPPGEVEAFVKNAQLHCRRVLEVLFMGEGRVDDPGMILFIHPKRCFRMTQFRWAPDLQSFDPEAPGGQEIDTDVDQYVAYFLLYWAWARLKRLGR